MTVLEHNVVSKYMHKYVKNGQTDGRMKDKAIPIWHQQRRKKQSNSSWNTQRYIPVDHLYNKNKQILSFRWWLNEKSSIQKKIGNLGYSIPLFSPPFEILSLWTI